MSQMRPLVAAVKSLVDRYPNRNITADTIMGYVEDLEDLPEPLVCAAIVRLRRTSTFLPSIAEIRALVIEAVEAPAMSAGEAWEIVQKQINRHGSMGYEHVTFDDPAIADAVRAVGWRRICLDELKYVRRDFEVALSASQDRHRRDVQDGSVAIGQAAPVVALERKTA